MPIHGNDLGHGLVNDLGDDSSRPDPCVSFFSVISRAPRNADASGGNIRTAAVVGKGQETDPRQLTRGQESARCCPFG